MCDLRSKVPPWEPPERLKCCEHLKCDISGFLMRTASPIENADFAGFSQGTHGETTLDFSLLGRLSFATLLSCTRVHFWLDPAATLDKHNHCYCFWVGRQLTAPSFCQFRREELLLASMSRQSMLLTRRNEGRERHGFAPASGILCSESRSDYTDEAASCVSLHCRLRYNRVTNLIVQPTLSSTMKKRR